MSDHDFIQWCESRLAKLPPSKRYLAMLEIRRIIDQALLDEMLDAVRKGDKSLMAEVEEIQKRQQEILAEIDQVRERDNRLQ